MKKLKPSELMRRGAAKIVEDPDSYLSTTLCVDSTRPCGCALGAVLVGRVGLKRASALLDDEGRSVTCRQLIAPLTGLDAKISDAHWKTLHWTVRKGYHDDESRPSYGALVDDQHASYRWNTERCIAWLERCGL